MLTTAPSRISALPEAKDGTLHVVWAGPNRGPFTAIFDTQISRQASSGSSVPSCRAGTAFSLPPPLSPRTARSTHSISGQKVPSNSDPYAGLNEVVGPGSWKLGAHAFGTYQITVPSNAEVGVARARKRPARQRLALGCFAALPDRRRSLDAAAEHHAAGAGARAP